MNGIGKQLHCLKILLVIAAFERWADMCVCGGKGWGAQIIVKRKIFKEKKDNRRRLNGSVSRLTVDKNFHESDSSEPCRTQSQF